ncbi:hypothetical protein [Olleya sp. YS]|uniref:hypothetical protein n=1 Tax=Olleya sp. YS TaxID=3028318 RepID=UPI0024344524|nr:hypothetical protein [Olleya sp. YS]WGD34675.1 hypothetical protein Ollyesu_12900 [Olleya sp. YS]
MKLKILLAILFFYTQNILAQSNSFEEKAAQITSKIDSITSTEKSKLKEELKKIDEKLEKNEINFDDANKQKNTIAEYHAKQINDAVFVEEQKLQALIKNRVSGKLNLEEDVNKKSNRFFTPFEDENYYKDSATGLKVEKRFTTQFVIALGLNIVLNDDKGFYGNGFKNNPLGYGELGFSFKYRLQEKSNLWNLKFGLSAMAYELRPKSNDDIVVTNQGLTTLENAGYNIKRSRFNNVYLGIPIHLELDFSKPQYDKKTNQTYLLSQRGFRLGLGGFFAIRVGSSQFIRYNNNEGRRIRLYEDGNFNVNTINFGPSAYIGYKDYSLYFKYDLNPVFKNNPQDINTFSISFRADLN